MNETQQKRADWQVAMKRRGHKAKLEGRSSVLDFFAVSSPGHNGPQCKTCGWSCCWHCTTIDEIPVCRPEEI